MLEILPLCYLLVKLLPINIPAIVLVLFILSGVALTDIPPTLLDVETRAIVL